MTAVPVRPGRDAWLNVAVKVAPRAPVALLTVLSAALAHPAAGSDALLWLADALDEGAKDAAAAGRTFLAAEMRALADLPRMLAPHRVGPDSKADVPEWTGLPMDLPESPFLWSAPGKAAFLRAEWIAAPSGTGEDK